MTRWAASQKHHNGRKQQHTQKDPNAMEIDTIRRKPTPEELKKLRAEGRCFYCRKQGHMSQNCPDKKKKTGKHGKTKARSLETKDSSSDSDESEPDLKSQASAPPSVISSNTLVS